MHSTHLRKEAIHGLMMGAAIGDALGFAREGMRRRTALKMFGRPPLRFRLVPGWGVYSDDTQVMLLTAQSVVQSISELAVFRTVFLKRLAWYSVSAPIGVGRATLMAGLKSWIRWLKIPTGCRSAGNGPALRSMFLSLAIYGTEHRLTRWVEDCTRLTHNDAMAVECCLFLGRLAQAVAIGRTKALDRVATLETLAPLCKDETLRKSVTQLIPFLREGRSPRAVARHFGWHHGISGYVLPSTVMSAYCFLRYPTSYRRAVESSIMLGGDTDSVAAIVGGLVGAHIGYANLPSELTRKINMVPHDGAWIAEMADRLAVWPHGSEDLHMAPALPSDPVLQVIRNLFLVPVVLLHLVLRLPWVVLYR